MRLLSCAVWLAALGCPAARQQAFQPKGWLVNGTAWATAMLPTCLATHVQSPASSFPDTAGGGCARGR